MNFETTLRLTEVQLRRLKMSEHMLTKLLDRYKVHRKLNATAHGLSLIDVWATIENVKQAISRLEMFQRAIKHDIEHLAKAEQIFVTKPNEQP